MLIFYFCGKSIAINIIVTSVMVMHDDIEMLHKLSILLSTVLSHVIILTYCALLHSTAIYSAVIYVALLVM